MDKYYEKRVLLFTLLIFLGVLFFIPLLFKIPIIKSVVLYLLSFTDNGDYKVAYIELIGALIGSFIAVYGALWVQRRINKNTEIDEQKKYACIAYYDLDFAFKDLLKIHSDTKRKYKIERFDNEENVDKFCKIALGRKLYLNQNWISDMAQLGEKLSQAELRLAYDCYGKLMDIDRALQSGEVDSIKNIYVTHISWLIDGNKEEMNSYCKNLLNKLHSVFIML